MLYGSATLLIVLGYFIVVVTVLTLLWRIAVALDHISEHLSDMSKDMKNFLSRTDDKQDK